MFVAVNEKNERCYAETSEKGEKYFCPICGGEVILKQGDVNIAHFAHKMECVDNWNYDMSDWHREWQEQFSSVCRERVIRHNGEVHRADIETRNYIIEFQHSPISAGEFYQRNKFFLDYGKKVIWIFDMREQFRTTIEWYEQTNRGYKYIWKYPQKQFRYFLPQRNKDILLFFQTTDTFFDIENSVSNFEDYAEEHDICAYYLEKVSWAIPEGTNSNFRRFVTEDLIYNKRELFDFLHGEVSYEEFTR